MRRMLEFVGSIASYFLVGFVDARNSTPEKLRKLGEFTLTVIAALIVIVVLLIWAMS